MAAIAGYQGSLLISSPPSVNVVNDVLTNPLADKKTYVEGTATHRYYDRNQPVTVQTTPDGTTWTTVTTGFTVQHVGGIVTFAVALTGATPGVRLSSVNYFPYVLVANIKQWQFDGEMSFEDSTTMSGVIGGGSGSAFKTFVPMLLMGTMQITKFWVPETAEGYIADIAGGSYLLFSGVAGTGNRYEGYGYLKKSGVKMDVSKLTENMLDVQFDGSFFAV